MKTRSTAALTGLAFGAAITAVGQLDYSWRYYRPGNTGVMGDYCEAIWIAPDGTPYLGGYNPQFEEGGFSRFIQAENRWENFSNVDYPVIGDRNVTGSARIREFVEDANGALWMATWVGLLYFDPAVGPDSLIRYDYLNSPLPSGANDIDIAPDGSIWIAHGNGGLTRFRPATGEWTNWGFDPQPDGWPGRSTLSAAVVQPKPGGGYYVWLDSPFGDVRYDSDTQQFSALPNNDTPGEIEVIPGGDACDDAGNVWMLRFTAPGQPYTLEYIQPDGTWVTPPPFPQALYAIPAIRAIGNGQCLIVGGDSYVFYYDGVFWNNLGQWRPGSYTYGVDIDAANNVWVCGVGGAARRDAFTGVWQRYRISNTGQMDRWVRDISFADNGDVWMTMNGASGIGGIGMFDGQRWYNFNIATYGLGGDWPYPCDNADAICYRPSTGYIAFNPTNNGIREWQGDAFGTLEELSTSDGLAEDSFGRLWTMGNYFSLRYHDGTGFIDVPIDGWGANVVADPDRPGTVWACANLEVVRTDGTYRFSRKVPDFPELNSVHDTLTTVAVDRNGIAWVGSTEGLFRVDVNTGTHQWFHSSNSAMPADQAWPLAVTPDGRVWFSNFKFNNEFEPALVWFDGVQFGTLTRADGLPHEQIYDGEARAVPGGYELWISCASEGVAVLTVNTGGFGDLDGDGDVDLTDLAILLSDFGCSGNCTADIDGDGDTDLSDLSLLLSSFGT